MDAAATNEILTHLTTGGVIVYAIESLKKAGWAAWITQDSKWVARLLSAIAAAGVALGLSYTGDAATGWVIHVPPLAVVLTGLWEWLKQVVMQQMVYDGLVARKKDA